LNQNRLFESEEEYALSESAETGFLSNLGKEMEAS
jgi:hypothetical protein